MVSDRLLYIYTVISREREMQTLTFNRSIDQLEERLISLARRRNEVEYELLKEVQEFDIRQGWRLWHLNNCAEWLNLKCSIALGTAREKVRVASALFNLPKCSAAFAAGDLSYSKARSLTRIATPENEEALLDYARSATASQVQAHCHGVRNAQEGPRRMPTTSIGAAGSVAAMMAKA